MDISTTSNAQTMSRCWWLVDTQKWPQSAVPVATAVGADAKFRKALHWQMIPQLGPQYHLCGFSFSCSPSPDPPQLPSTPACVQWVSAARPAWETHGSNVVRSKPGSLLPENIARSRAMFSICFLPTYKKPSSRWAWHAQPRALSSSKISPWLCCLSLQSRISSLDFFSQSMQSLSSCCYLPQLCQCPWQSNTVPWAQGCVNWAGLVKNPPLPSYLYRMFKTKMVSGHLCSMFWVPSLATCALTRT